MKWNRLYWIGFMVAVFVFGSLSMASAGRYAISSSKPGCYSVPTQGGAQNQRDEITRSKNDGQTIYRLSGETHPVDWVDVQDNETTQPSATFIAQLQPAIEKVSLITRIGRINDPMNEDILRPLCKAKASLIRLQTASQFSETSGWPSDHQSLLQINASLNQDGKAAATLISQEEKRMLGSSEKPNASDWVLDARTIRSDVTEQTVAREGAAAQKRRRDAIESYRLVRKALSEYSATARHMQYLHSPALKANQQMDLLECGVTIEFLGMTDRQAVFREKIMETRTSHLFGQNSWTITTERTTRVSTIDGSQTFTVLSVTDSRKEKSK